VLLEASDAMKLPAIVTREGHYLANGESPARPSVRLRMPSGGKLLTVPVPVKLVVPLSIWGARRHAALSQADLARRMGVSQQQAAKFDQHANPTVDTLTKVAEALGVEPEMAVCRTPGCAGEPLPGEPLRGSSSAPPCSTWWMSTASWAGGGCGGDHRVPGGVLQR
jgi:hypothetical protein